MRSRYSAGRFLASILIVDTQWSSAARLLLPVVMPFGIVKDVNKIITITRKGQTTLPVTMRQKLGIGPAGGTLRATFNGKHSGIPVTHV
jgi:hypothetical protein